MRGDHTDGYTVFETKRLLLKPTDLGDAGFIFALLNTPKFIKYVGDRELRTEGHARKYIKTKMLKQLTDLGYSTYTLIKKESNEKIGTCGLYKRDGLKDVDIGFAFLPEHEKQGYGFEAATKVKELAFTKFGIKKLVAITTKENIGSQRLLKKLGMIFCGTTTIPDDDETLLLYELEA